MTNEWYVLIEEDTRTTEHPDGVELKLHRWTLVGAHPIGHDEAEAVAAAEDAALHYTPLVLARNARPGDEPARHAFLAQDGAWVVLVRQRHRECHIRVTTARLVHSQAEKEAPAKSLKEKFRGALEGPPALVKPWAPPGKRQQA
ncbi:hypothetical protein [Streptomyces sp. WM6378]|uniref:hypothetical protein n=1 Tax=Streptomyces sp. WM6378 TaxID=1415557 RepID=UPI0006ADFE03|nr:hypothetical protein [Streptomyces sp. WM6378]KOU39602.1 hypothetical protein ADK54_25180 [Streptomyces sp. WM6378]